MMAQRSDFGGVQLFLASITTTLKARIKKIKEMTITSNQMDAKMCAIGIINSDLKRRIDVRQVAVVKLRSSRSLSRCCTRRL